MQRTALSSSAFQRWTEPINQALQTIAGIDRENLLVSFVPRRGDAWIVNVRGTVSCNGPSQRFRGSVARTEEGLYRVSMNDGSVYNGRNFGEAVAELAKSVKAL